MLMSWYMYVLLLNKLIAIVVGLYHWRKIDFFFRLIVLHVVVAFIAELVGMCMSMMHFTNNTIVFNLFMPVEFTVLCASSLYFYTSRSARSIVIGLISGGIIYWLYHAFVYNLNDLFNWYRLVISIIIVSIFTIIMLSKTVFTDRKIFTQPVFLVSSAKVLYYAVTIPLFGLYTYMIENGVSAISKLYYISHVTDFIQFFTVGLAIYLYIRLPQNNETRRV